MRLTLLIVFLFFQYPLLWAQLLPGFKVSGAFNEQQKVIENSPENTRILINAPLDGFERGNDVLMVFYALPNGSTIEQSIGKDLRAEDDWRYDIQHIGAQTRFLRSILKKKTLVIVYLEASQKSWPLWKANTSGSNEKVKETVDGVKGIFARWNPQIVLNGHSGGGRFIFSYIEASEDIPDDVVRISFLGSSYGYEDTIHGPKLAKWLKAGNNRYLCTLAYNDSVVIYNDKPLVSPSGGTWYRSRMMQKYLSGAFRFRTSNRDTLLWYKSHRNKIEFVMKTNPEKEIFHTQVLVDGKPVLLTEVLKHLVLYRIFSNEKIHVRQPFYSIDQ